MNVMALLADAGRINFSKLYWTNLLELSDVPISWNWFRYGGDGQNEQFTIMGGQI